LGRTAARYGPDRNRAAARDGGGAIASARDAVVRGLSVREQSTVLRRRSALPAARSTASRDQRGGRRRDDGNQRDQLQQRRQPEHAALDGVDVVRRQQAGD